MTLLPVRNMLVQETNVNYLKVGVVVDLAANSLIFYCHYKDTVFLRPYTHSFMSAQLDKDRFGDAVVRHCVHQFLQDIRDYERSLEGPTSWRNSMAE